MPISMTGDVLWKIPNTNPILYPSERIWLFNNLPNAVDLYIKDSEEDTGKEPNTITKRILEESRHLGEK